MRNDSARQLQKFDANMITNSKMADKMVSVKHYNWLLLSHLLILTFRFFFTEMCVMTPDISDRGVIQMELQILRWRTKWRPCKGVTISQAFIYFSSVIAYCISPHAGF